MRSTTYSTASATPVRSTNRPAQVGPLGKAITQPSPGSSGPRKRILLVDDDQGLTAEHPLLPIIIATARPNQLFTAVSAGAGALLEKPMDIPTLLRTIKMLLVETAEQRLARLVGKKAEFHYMPATARRDKQPQI